MYKTRENVIRLGDKPLETCFEDHPLIGLHLVPGRHEWCQAFYRVQDVLLSNSVHLMTCQLNDTFETRAEHT